MISYTTLINDLLTQVDTLLADYVQNGYQSLVDYLAAPLGAAIVLFFVCYGVSISQGWIKGSVSGLTHALFKIGAIYFIAMNWGNFSFYVYNLFYKGASEIGSVLLEASPIHFSTSGELDINSALQTVLNEILDIAQWIFIKGGIGSPGLWIGGILVGAVGILLVGLALLEIVIAKCMLSILFVIAPLFIAFTLFEATESFFDKWLGACVGYASLMILISASLGIVLSLDYWIVDDMHLQKAADITWINTGTIILVTWVCIGIIKRISLLAMSIGGTAGTVSGNEMIGGAVGTFLNPSRDRNDSSKPHGYNESGRTHRSAKSNDGDAGSKSSANNPAINDRSRFIDGRNNHDTDRDHSAPDHPTKPDKPTRPDNRVRPDRHTSDNHPKVIRERTHSSSGFKEKVKKEFSDYE